MNQEAGARSRVVTVGTLPVGGGSPVSVQTMWKAPLEGSIAGVVTRIESLAADGCDLIRFAVPGFDQVPLVGEVAREVSIPVVADIHYNHRLALACMDYPVAKIRVNPGTLADPRGVEEVVRKAADTATALRVGVNGGSLPSDLEDDADTAQAMVRAAEGELDILARLDFHDVVFSLKASDMATTVSANRAFARRHDYPLHLGVTEAGPLVPGIIKSTLALGELLRDGIGDTIRISLSDTPEREVETGRWLLAILGLRDDVEIISCPTCGRTVFDVQGAVDIVSRNRHLAPPGTRIAVMGCPVNGPGEARGADLAITGSGREVCIFRNGEVLRRVGLDEVEQALQEELNRL